MGIPLDLVEVHIFLEASHDEILIHILLFGSLQSSLHWHVPMVAVAEGIICCSVAIQHIPPREQPLVLDLEVAHRDAMKSATTLVPSQSIHEIRCIHILSAIVHAELPGDTKVLHGMR